MPLPSKSQQIAAVVKFLDADRNQERSLEEIASDIVTGYHEALTKDLKKPATPLRVGVLIKSPLDAKVRRVAWMDGDLAWIVLDNSSYGFLGSSKADLWDACEEYRPKRRMDVEGATKLIEMTDEQIDAAWANSDGWQVGDRVSFGQRQLILEIIATAPSCVLMRKEDGQLMAESNAGLKRYQREMKVEEVTW